MLFHSIFILLIILIFLPVYIIFFIAIVILIIEIFKLLRIIFPPNSALIIGVDLFTMAPNIALNLPCSVLLKRLIYILIMLLLVWCVDILQLIWLIMLDCWFRFLSRKSVIKSFRVKISSKCFLDFLGLLVNIETKNLNVCLSYVLLGLLNNDLRLILNKIFISLDEIMRII